MASSHYILITEKGKFEFDLELLLTELVQKFIFRSWPNLNDIYIYKEEFEDTEGVIRIGKSKDRQLNSQTETGQKDKQQSTKHYKLKIE